MPVAPLTAPPTPLAPLAAAVETETGTVVSCWLAFFTMCAMFIPAGNVAILLGESRIVISRHQRFPTYLIVRHLFYQHTLYDVRNAFFIQVNFHEMRE